MRIKIGRVYDSQRKAIVILLFGFLIGLVIHASLVSPEPTALCVPQLGPNVTIVASPPDDSKVVIELIDSARKEILLSAYMLNHVGITAALKGAAKRGVSVRIIVDDQSPTKKVTGCELRICHFYRLYHPKLLIIDSEIVFIGSHNFTNPAFGSNREISLIAHSTSLAAELSMLFQGDWARSIPT